MKKKLKTQERFKSGTKKIFIEEINKIALSSNSDKIMQSIDLIETYSYGMRKYLIRKKDEINCIGIIK